MIKYFVLLLIPLLVNCSFDTRSGIWTENKDIAKIDENISKVFKKKTIIKKEFNSDLKIETNFSADLKNDKNELANNLGIDIFDHEIKKISKFKFSKIENFDYFEPELIADENTFAFFDDKGNLIKFNDNLKTIWKKNYYTKQEKKMKPILTLYKHDKYLIVVDTISKFYVVNYDTGNLIWSKKNRNPFNSQIKIFRDKIFTIDMNNILRCFSLKNGDELWNFKSENTFLKSNKRSSIVVINNNVYFNNSVGDIIALSTSDGSVIWQMPTQSSDVYENSFSLINSDLVAKDNDLFFSNNRNEFYSMNLSNGLINWKQEINSIVRPIIYNNLILTFSNEGYFFVIDKNNGNIIRITDVFDVFEDNKRKKINPIGFIAGTKKIILSLNNGRLLIIDILTGKTEKISKIDNEKISRPFIFDKKIMLVKNNSIIRLN